MILRIYDSMISSYISRHTNLLRILSAFSSPVFLEWFLNILQFFLIFSIHLHKTYQIKQNVFTIISQNILFCPHEYEKKIMLTPWKLFFWMLMLFLLLQAEKQFWSYSLVYKIGFFQLSTPFLQYFFPGPQKLRQHKLSLSHTRASPKSNLLIAPKKKSLKCQYG